MDESNPPESKDGTDPPVSSTVESLLREVARAPRACIMPSPGQVVGGKYRIERLIGRGGMGPVFAAHHELLRQPVALKVMLAATADSDQAAVRFLNEARAAAKIEGEHVARVLDVGQFDDGAPFIAMEFLDGSDLSRVLAQRGAFSARVGLRDHLFPKCVCGAVPGAVDQQLQTPAAP